MSGAVRSFLFGDNGRLRENESGSCCFLGKMIGTVPDRKV